MNETTNAFKMAQQQFDHVAEQLRLDPQVREFLRWPMREFHFRIPVRNGRRQYENVRRISCAT
jgi:glutamate dehydrogenase (NAD(P)+)